jgi:hypothetical protein
VRRAPRCGSCDEPEKGLAVVALGKPLSIHETTLFEDRVRVEESICRDQVHPRVMRPASQKRLENTGNRRFPDGHRARHPDDERLWMRLSAQKRVCDRRQELAPLHIEIQESGQGKEGLFDHVDIEVDADPAELVDFLGCECERGAPAQARPVLAIEVEIVAVFHVHVRLLAGKEGADLRYSRPI